MHANAVEREGTAERTELFGVEGKVLIICMPEKREKKRKKIH